MTWKGVAIRFLIVLLIAMNLLGDFRNPSHVAATGPCDNASLDDPNPPVGEPEPLIAGTVIDANTSTGVWGSSRNKLYQIPGHEMLKAGDAAGGGELTWGEGVIPLWTDDMWFDAEMTEELVGDLAAGPVRPLQQVGLDGQATVGAGAADEGEHSIQGAQRDAGPVGRDGPEEQMLDRVPLRAAGGVMTDGDFDAVNIDEEALQALLPEANPAAVGAATVSQKQQALGVGIGRPPFVGPPTDNGIDGEVGGLGGCTDVDMAALGRQIVDAIGHRLRRGVARKVVDVHAVRLLAPGSTGILEITDQLFFLVSTLMTGSPAAMKAVACSLMYRNCTSLSACLGPDFSLALTRNRYLRSRSRWRRVSWLAL